MDNKKLIKQIVIIILIILGFILFNYSFYNLVTKNYINNYGKGMQEKSIDIESYLPFKDDSLIVTHRGIINMMYFMFNNEPLTMNKKKFNVDHASVHELDIEKRKIRRIGE